MSVILKYSILFLFKMYVYYIRMPTRKHSGIIQSGKNAGRLRKGFRFNGRRSKTGLPIIVKSKTKKVMKNVHRGGAPRNSNYDPVQDVSDSDNISPSPLSAPPLRRQNAIQGRQASLENARRELRERQAQRARAAAERFRNSRRMPNTPSNDSPRS
jgi:hypothetical protein